MSGTDSRFGRICFFKILSGENSEIVELFKNIINDFLLNEPHVITEDLEDECETFINQLKDTAMIYSAGHIKRAIIDFALKNVMNLGRKCRLLDNLRKKSPKDAE